jgi:hypothetical protein
VDGDVIQDNLRYILNEWDPIGVADVAPDEYDCMVPPLLGKLRAGGGRADISEWLCHTDQRLLRCERATGGR